MSKLIRISEELIRELDELSNLTGESKQKLMKKAIKDLAKKLFLLKANQELHEIKKNKAVWQDLQEEQELWDHTLVDGLDDE